MITTKKVELTPREFFLIFDIQIHKKQWWLFAGIWLLTILFAADVFSDSFQRFFLVFLY
jgi:hypothetical protein